MDRLRGRLRDVLARALRAARRHRGHRRPSARRGGAHGGSRDGALGHVSAQARRNSVGARGSRSDAAARGLALRLRRLRERMRAAADRAQRALGRFAADPADANGRALPRERAPLRDPSCRARRPPGAARFQRAFHRRRRGGVVASDRTGVGHRPREVREREPDLARRRRRRVATPAHWLPIVRGQAVRDRRSAVSHRPHDRLPDRGRLGRARGVAAALTLVRRREVAGVRGRAGVSRAPTDPRLVVGLGAAQRALERPGQDLRRVCLAVGAGSGSLRRARDPRRGARLRPPRRARSTFPPAFAASTTDKRSLPPRSRRSRR